MGLRCDAQWAMGLRCGCLVASKSALETAPGRPLLEKGLGLAQEKDSGIALEMNQAPCAMAIGHCNDAQVQANGHNYLAH
jgi:hypothetical protein